MDEIVEGRVERENCGAMWREPKVFRAPATHSRTEILIESK
jgi:hypothetical protein